MADSILPGSDPNEIGGLIIKKKSTASDKNFRKPSILGLDKKKNYDSSSGSERIMYKNKYNSSRDRGPERQSRERSREPSTGTHYKKDPIENSPYIPATPRESRSKDYLRTPDRYNSNSSNNDWTPRSTPSHDRYKKPVLHKHSWEGTNENSVYGNIRNSTTGKYHKYGDEITDENEREQNFKKMKESKEYQDQQNDIDRSWYTLDEGGGEIPDLFDQDDEIEMLEKRHKQAAFQDRPWRLENNFFFKFIFSKFFSS